MPTHANHELFEGLILIRIHTCFILKFDYAPSWKKNFVFMYVVTTKRVKLMLQKYFLVFFLLTGVLSLEVDRLQRMDEIMKKDRAANGKLS